MVGFLAFFRSGVVFGAQSEGQTPGVRSRVVDKVEIKIRRQVHWSIRRPYNEDGDVVVVIPTVPPFPLVGRRDDRALGVLPSAPATRSTESAPRRKGFPCLSDLSFLITSFAVRRTVRLSTYWGSSAATGLDIGTGMGGWPGSGEVPFNSAFVQPAGIRRDKLFWTNMFGLHAYLDGRRKLTKSFIHVAPSLGLVFFCF